MKKLVSVFLLIAMLLMSVTAFADVDLASMSNEELEQLIQNAQAELNSRKSTENASALETDGEVSILEAGWGIQSGYLFYSFSARSNLTDKAIKYPEFRIVIRDAAGDLIGTDNYTHDYLLPGKTIYCTSQGPKVEGETPTTIEVEWLEPDNDRYYVDVEEVKFYNLQDPVVETAKLKKDSFFSRIVGEISNPNSEKIEKARVVVFFRDADGKLVAGDATWVQSIKPGKKTAFEISVYSDLVTDNYDVFAMIDR